MKEIKLATVFSGIGAIEHALDRMELPHKIVFACDNGDVDVLSKSIPLDIVEIQKELKSLGNQISKIEVISEEDNLYKNELTLILSKTKEEIKNYETMKSDGTDEKKNDRKLNVKVLLNNDEGRTWETISKIFTDLDYVWKKEVLNAKDYGIPQNRERVFVVGFRKDIVLKKEFSFPEKIPLEKKMQDFLLDNVPGGYFLPEKGVDFVTKEKNLEKRYTQIDGEIQLCQKKKQQFNWHGDFVFQSEDEAKQKIKKDLEKYFLSEKVRKYVLATGTKNFYSRPKTDLEIARPLLTTMHKMHRAGVDNYVTTDGRLRKLTPRECLRLWRACINFAKRSIVMWAIFLY